MSIRSTQILLPDTSSPSVENAPVSLERDAFLHQLLRHLAAVLQTTVDLEKAEGFVTAAAQRFGDEINSRYRKAAGRNYTVLFDSGLVVKPAAPPVT